MAEQTVVGKLGVYDFGSPFMSAAIVTSEGKRYPIIPSGPLTGAPTSKSGGSEPALTGFSASGSPQEINFLPYLSSVSINVGAGIVPQITATLTPPYLEGRKLIDLPIVEYAKSTIEVTVGYSAGRGSATSPAVSPVYAGLLLRPDISFGPDISIQFNGQGTGGYALASGKVNVTLKAQPRRKTLEFLCKKLNLKLDTKHADANPKSKRALDGNKAFSASNEAYLNSIQLLARECSCYVYLDGSNVVLKSMDSVLKSEDVVAELVLFAMDATGSIGPASGRYPILSVSTDHDGIFLTSDTVLKNSSQVATKTGKSQKAAVTAADTTGNAKGGKAAPKEDTDTDKVARDQRPATSVEEAKDTALAGLTVKRASDSNAGIQLEIETIGIPDLLPLQNIKVTNVSNRLDGLYTVLSLKHDVSSSGFTTSITAIQNAMGIFDKSRGLYTPAQTSQAVVKPPDPAASQLAPAPTTPVTPKPQRGA